MKPILIFLLIFFAGFTRWPAFAITVCHDYTAYVVTGQDSNKLEEPNNLRNLLKKNQYNIAFVIPPGETVAALEPGDIIIIGEAHSGVINKNRRIDHYLQPSGTVTTSVSPAELLAKPRNNFFKDKSSWTLADIRDVHRTVKQYTDDPDNPPQESVIYPYKDQQIEVWRSKNTACLDISGPWVGTLKVTAVEGDTFIKVDDTRLVRNKEFQVIQQDCDITLQFNANEISGTFADGVATLKNKKAGSVTEAILTPEGSTLNVKIKQSGGNNVVTTSEGNFTKNATIASLNLTSLGSL